MHRLLSTLSVLALRGDRVRAGPRDATAAPAAQEAGGPRRHEKKAPLVEFEMMTWPEVKAALAAGKTTALVYTGGTEQRGPQNVNGGHTLMARATVKAIALQARQRDRDADAAPTRRTTPAPICRARSA